MNGSVPLEIERKFLIRRPDEELLRRESVRRIDMTQSYLTPGPEGETRRLRHSRQADGEAWYFTEKKRITALTRVEREREVTREEYEALRAQLDPGRRVIEKTRWCVPYEGHTLEIDVFPFWDDRAFCEAELESEDEELRLPDWLHVVREVSDDPRYTNSALAREIPMDILPEM